MDSKLQHPTVFILVGIPGSGKTNLARQLSQKLGISRVSAEQIRSTISGPADPEPVGRKTG